MWAAAGEFSTKGAAGLMFQVKPVLELALPASVTVTETMKLPGTSGVPVMWPVFALMLSPLGNPEALNVIALTVGIGRADGDIERHANRARGVPG